MSEKCCNRVGVQSTHWEGCHEVHPSCAAFKAGREAGMREAAGIASREEDVFIAESAQPFIERSLERHYMALASGAGSVGAAILAAIGEGK